MNAFFSVWERYILLFAFLAVLAGCSVPLPPSQPFSCIRLTETHWVEFNFGVDSPDDVISIAISLWETERSQVQSMLNVDDEIMNVWWRSDATIGIGETYQAWFREGRQLIKINVRWGHPRPTLTQLVDCLGIPEHYIAFYDQAPEAIRLRLILLYSEKGVIVRYDSPYTSFLRPELPEIHPDVRIDKLVVVAPGPPDQMVTDLYSVGNEGSVYKYSTCLRKPWPGSIKAMEVEPAAEFHRCIP